MLLFYLVVCFVFFFNDTATTEIYTLSLHDALPIYACALLMDGGGGGGGGGTGGAEPLPPPPQAASDNASVRVVKISRNAFIVIDRIWIPDKQSAHRSEDFSAVPAWLPGFSLRSEERRVGKECRSRWSPYH